MRAVILLILPAFLASLAQTASAAEPSFEGLGDLSGGTFSSGPRDVSADGSVVVGTSHSEFGSEAFRWDSTTGMVGLGDLPGAPPGREEFRSTASAVSADGSVVVGWGNSELGVEAFLWTQTGGMIGLGDLPTGDFHSQASGVSADGLVVVGWSHLLAPGEQSRNTREAFRWTATTGMVPLGWLPADPVWSEALGISADGMVVVGESGSSPNSEAFSWTEATGIVGMGDIPGSSFESRALAASADGSVIVGIGRGEDGGNEAFRWTAETGMVGLGDLPGGNFSSGAYDVSADGSIVVGDSEADSGGQAIIWDETHGLRNLRDVLVNEYGLNLTGWTLRGASAISADGSTIVGGGINPSGYGEAWRAVIPVCGNGVVELGEVCDDGNKLSGDCCASDCTLELAGSSCDDLNPCTEDEECDGSGGCVADLPADCDDADPCTIDTCDPLIGCLHSDEDADTVGDLCDNCPFEANPEQEDFGTIGDWTADGIGDACQCGDVTDDGTVSINDATIIKRAILGLGPGMKRPLKCNVIGVTDPSDTGGLPADCKINDATVIKRAILGLGPGIQQVCAPAANQVR